MMSVGLRALKNQTSRVLRRVAGGEPLVVTDRHRPVAVLVPAGGRRDDATARLHALRESGRVGWAGGKPRGLVGGPATKGATVSDAVIQDRR
jgi:prevent-host-death family protein